MKPQPTTSKTPYGSPLISRKISASPRTSPSPRNSPSSGKKVVVSDARGNISPRSPRSQRADAVPSLKEHFDLTPLSSMPTTPQSSTSTTPTNSNSTSPRNTSSSEVSSSDTTPETSPRNEKETISRTIPIRSSSEPIPIVKPPNKETLKIPPHKWNKCQVNNSNSTSIVNPIEKPPLYVVFCVETDGQCPGLNSLKSVSFGGFIFEENGNKYKEIFEESYPLKQLSYCAPDPDTIDWKIHEENLRKSLDHPDFLDPIEIFKKLKLQFLNLKKKYRIVSGMWSASSEWQWVNYYFCALTGGNPLGSNAKCIGTLYESAKQASMVSKIEFPLNTPKVSQYGIIWMDLLVQFNR
jgi:hypothetical protein